MRPLFIGRAPRNVTARATRELLKIERRRELEQSKADVAAMLEASAVRTAQSAVRIAPAPVAPHASWSQAHADAIMAAYRSGDVAAAEAAVAGAYASIGLEVPA